jgi:hypothetical protein
MRGVSMGVGQHLAMFLMTLFLTGGLSSERGSHFTSRCGL